MIFFMAVIGIAVKKQGTVNSVLTVLLPLIAFIIIAQTINSCKSYMDYKVYNLPKESVLMLGNDILNQYYSADRLSLSEMELHVIDNPNNGNT